MLVILGTVLALTGIAIALTPPASSQAATGQKWLTGVPYAGAMRTTTAYCSVTVVSEWMAITNKHCGTVNPQLKLNVSALTTPGFYQVSSITPNPTLDVEAIFLQKKTGLAVTPLRTSFALDRFSGWGYGADHSGNVTNWLTRADFDRPEVCPAKMAADGGSLCWDTTDTNNVCSQDSGGPITQNGAIIGMMTYTLSDSLKPDGSPVCSTVFLGQALTIKQMQPWLDQMIKAADPSD